MTGQISERTSERTALGATDTGGDADAPRVPVSAGAWGADSAQALGVRGTDGLTEGSEGSGGSGGSGRLDRLAGTPEGVVQRPEDLAERPGGVPGEGPDEDSDVGHDEGLLVDPAAWRSPASTAPTAATGVRGGAGVADGADVVGGSGSGRDAGADDTARRDASPADVSRDDVSRTEAQHRADVARIVGAREGAESRGAESRGAGAGGSEHRGADVDGRAANHRPAHRRSGADPVKGLMHRHRELCERAVDALEIAAGLEAHGVTDRTAARFRHKDVFSLAEEMYARMPRDGEPDEPLAGPAGPTTGVRGLWAALALLPGVAGALTLFGLHATTGPVRLAVGIAGLLVTLVALRATLRHGPLRAVDGPSAPSARLWSCWLLAYALLGDGLLSAALAGGPDETWAPATAPLIALAVAVAPATWCAQLFAGGARRRLATSRGLAEFASAVRPLLLGSIALFALALVALLVLAGVVLHEQVDYAGAGALGVLLLLSRLLAAHRRTHAPAVALGAAVAFEVLAVATVFAARLPGCDVLGVLVETAVDALGTGIVPAVACAGAALVLLVHATRTLTRASAHAHPDDSFGGAS
ncbi:hypothetical protein ABZY90_37635 [Streptomyces sp. NPDC006422]|uniref:hypothetical protein n=1 Tax=unclassified Streptomyces TaxID=2593676 RepID=UPI0033B39100